jgi:hypothetical protein
MSSAIFAAVWLRMSFFSDVTQRHFLEERIFGLGIGFNMEENQESLYLYG